MDFITKLLASKNLVTGVEYNTILIIVDIYTKWSYFLPYKEK
jgi:hypothetical protein